LLECFLPSLKPEAPVTKESTISTLLQNAIGTTRLLGPSFLGPRIGDATARVRADSGKVSIKTDLEKWGMGRGRNDDVLLKSGSL
jgi:hypothetical protein